MPKTCEWNKVRVDSVSERFETTTARETLAWSIENFYPKLTLATAFGPEGCVLIHLLAELEPRVSIFNLETGYQFPETLELRDRLQERYGVHIELVEPNTTVEEYERLHDEPLYGSNPSQCCHDRKVVPLRRFLAGMTAWISGIRADQTPDRNSARVLMWDAKFHLVKINPLLHWTKKQVWEFLLQHNVPYNPLHDQGFPSIGCWPCTRPVATCEDDRAGRWSGTAKNECGLHTLPQVESLPSDILISRQAAPG